MNKMPLSIIMESAKSSIKASVNSVLNDTKLPAYLVEGMICEILAEVRNQKNIELLADINTMNSKHEDSEQKEE